MCEGAVCTGPPLHLAHGPSWSSPAHAALCWPSVAPPWCWAAADARARGTGQCPRARHTNHSSVVLNSPECHQTATEADGNQLHPVPFMLPKSNRTSQGVCHALRLSQLTARFLTSLFRSYLFPVCWGHWLLLGMSSGFCLTNFLLMWGTEQGNSFFSVLPVCYQALGFLLQVWTLLIFVENYFMWWYLKTFRVQ